MGTMSPIHTKLCNNGCPMVASTNACWIMNQFWRFHVDIMNIPKHYPFFFKKTCSLKKLKFEIFEIFTNNIINVKIAKVFEYVCFEELGEILNPLALKLGPIFWIANSSGWWFKLYDAHWFWVQKKPILDPCEVVLKLDSRPISSFNFFKRTLKL